METVSNLVARLWAERMEACPELGWALAIFALAVPLELRFGSGHAARWSERLGNVGALLLHFFLGGMVALGALLGLEAVGLRPLAYPQVPRWPILDHPLVWALAAVFVVDGLFYLYHRLQHRSVLLWHIHKLHHTDPAMNITTARRTHFLERGVQYLLLLLPEIWILGLHPQGLIYAGYAGAFFLYFAHLDIRLPLGPLTPIVVGPQYHRVHHGAAVSQQHANFAQVFPLFDILGGTYYRPARSEYPVTGLDECLGAVARWRALLW